VRDLNTAMPVTASRRIATLLHSTHATFGCSPSKAAASRRTGWLFLEQEPTFAKVFGTYRYGGFGETH
jgi:hypothetical protein